MKLFILSEHRDILKNTGFIRGSYTTHEEAFAASKIGEFIHVIEVEYVNEIISGGKMAVRLDGSTK